MAGAAADRREGKIERVELRATTRQTAAIREAAHAAGKTVSAFILDSAFEDAQRVLADRRLFLLETERWERFVKALDRRPKSKPRLRELMRKPSVLE